MDFINWPVAAGAVIVVFMLLFRKPISNLLERTKNVSVGKVGLKATPGHRMPTIDGQSQARLLLQAPDSEIQAEQETAIRNKLDQISGDPREREDLLVRDLASARACELLEQVYQQIWGSQLAALQFVSENTGAITTDPLRIWYDQGLAQWKKDGGDAYEFEVWLRFLIDTKLIAIPNDNNLISITTYGREFLTYLAERGHSIYKDF